MPRTKLTDKYSAPPKRSPDRIKGLILEGMSAAGVNGERMAEELDFSIQTWYTRMKAPTTDWKLGELITACLFLGIDLDELRDAIPNRA